MSVKVVSPTDPGQPQLPMSLRPPVTPAAPGTHHGRPRRPRPSPPASALRQPELPMSPPPVAEGHSADTAAGPPHAGSAAEELPVAGVEPAHPAPISAEPPAVGAQPQLPMPVRPPASADVPAEPAQPGLPMPVRPPAPAPAPTAPTAASPQPVPLSPSVAAESDQSQLPMSLRPPAPPAAAALLAQARRGLAEAERETTSAERFIGAYLAALRGAAAVLEARGRPHRGRARPASSWVLLDSVAPELREWSAFFAGNSATRAAAQAGITGKVTGESAAQLVRAAGLFLELVRRLVHGLPISGEAHVA
ncbi:SAV_6107 family HEPN domain-containing protein [Amycolatopsis lexingtonensis]|uniref:SAV_6107 family HEPN domain-containing protein n=1 Tax=Amycolatopsis lexingtonensis TaxID=218822 RepID=UPI003F6EABB8